MITAIVRYRIAPGSHSAKGLISKHFIWGEHGIADGGYQWEMLEEAKAFYSGLSVFAITHDVEGTVKVLGKARRQALETSLQK